MNELESWQQFWDERYSHHDYAYGINPNEFFREQLRKLPSGKILLPAEGEGRNAVFASRLGWKVSAYDISREGQKKAYLLAHKHQVHIDYHVGDIDSVPYTENQFDAIALLYAHFPAYNRPHIHTKLQTFLRKGGMIILEGFSKNHLEYRKKNEALGGPNKSELLFSRDELVQDFPNFNIISLEEKEIELHEGLYHNGLSSVMRFTAIKK